MLRIVGIGLSTLEYSAVQSLFARYGDTIAESFSTFEKFSLFSGNFDIFVASTDIILGNLDYFMPRKARTIVISDSADMQDAVFHTIGKNTDYGDIESMVASMASAVGGGETAGELSSRELEVLRELASGKTQKEIADVLCISPSTVVTHRKNISTKLGIRSVSGLSLYAVMNGII